MKARIPNQNNMSRNDMMAKIQKMQEDMANKQAEVENSEFTASAGGGAVEVRVSGKHEILGISIKPEVVDPEDVEMLEDLLIASLNEAVRKATEAMDREMNSLTGGLNIPGLGL
ncbi:MAG: YbaB/EbfC family nucleoid-associated protein [Ruminococcaceae bacterium]|nr:YbaB/EbfC family nucleoid-associated protein [Oscillospiraceae bacterium]MBR3596470.1 YbaB/EbfC family nucleoid-associated protein [Clostridia bacterium]